MKTRFILVFLSLASIFLLAASCTDEDWVIPGQPAIEPTPTETPVPTASSTMMHSPNPYAAFADLNAILYSDLISNPPVFQPGETPWIPDLNVYVFEIYDNGQNNFAEICNFPEGAADDGIIDLSDYPSGPVTTISECFGGASRRSGGQSSGPFFYVIRKDGNNGTILDVSLNQYVSHGMDISQTTPSYLSSLTPVCTGEICIGSNAHVLEGSLVASQP